MRRRVSQTMPPGIGMPDRPRRAAPLYDAHVTLSVVQGKKQVGHPLASRSGVFSNDQLAVVGDAKG